MQAVQSWAMSVCLAALAAGIAGVLAPKGNLEKIYKFAVSLFFLCCLLVPLFSLRHISLPTISVPSADVQVSDFSRVVAEQSLEQVRDNVASVARSVCAKQGVTPVSVDVTVQKDSNGAYDPQSISITLASGDAGRQGSLASAVQVVLGIPVKIQAQ